MLYNCVPFCIQFVADETMDEKLIYIPNDIDYKQNYPFVV